MSLLVIDFTYLDGRDGEMVVKELPLSTPPATGAYHIVFKRSYSWEEVPMFNARINQAVKSRFQLE